MIREPGGISTPSAPGGRRRLLRLAGIGLLGSPVPLGQGRQTTSAMSRPRPRIIAHRGSSATAPENTLAAFRLALDEEANGIEGDFRLSADGRIVCLHDASTRRTTGRDLAVAAAPLEELRELDAGGWKHPRFAGERIPILGEVLALLPRDKFLFLEIKCGTEIVAPLAEALAEERARAERIVLIAFDPAVIHACRRALPQHPAHWLSRLENFRRPAVRAGVLDTLRDCGATGLGFRQDAPVTAGWLAELRACGLGSAA